MTAQTIKIGLVSISDRASTGVYQDLGLPHLQAWLGKTLTTPWEAFTRLIPDEKSEMNLKHASAQDFICQNRHEDLV